MFPSQSSWKYQLRNMRSAISDNQNIGINLSKSIEIVEFPLNMQICNFLYQWNDEMPFGRGN